MIELLPPAPLLLAFLLASLILALTPGPGVVYIVTRTLAQGRASGLASVAGVALGNFGNAAAASIGLAALLSASATIFDAVRYAGAAYLCYLGLQALRADPSKQRSEPVTTGIWRVLGQGFLVALLNPKTTLFFAAFLPQFMQPTASPVLQALALSAVFVAVAAISDAGYVLLAATLAPALRSAQGAARMGRYVAAAVYFALGLYAALTGTRPAKT
ncbi:LysE family translocator [Roseateles violae]|uniref:LysE family translocator n=1 Tax=Roseateles violae TaxID=3058042 RepID=A0ABT8DXT0_9BURK|nr:LysE family translocator [Pelomonas sp. PFR6]MDN3922234.1 LysE family translocator [Pelomonas sp. PFR6]